MIWIIRRATAILSVPIVALETIMPTGRTMTVSRDAVAVAVDALAWITGQYGTIIEMTHQRVVRWAVWDVSPPDAKDADVSLGRHRVPLSERLSALPARGRQESVDTLTRAMAEYQQRGHMAGVLAVTDVGEVLRLVLSRPEWADTDWGCGPGTRRSPVVWLAHDHVRRVLFGGDGPI